MRRAVAIISAIALTMGLATCASPTVDPSVPRAGASSAPLFTQEEFLASMSGYPLVVDAASQSAPLPGIFGAYGLSPRPGSDAYELATSQHYTFQGVAVSDDQIFLSAYDHRGVLNSVIFVLDSTGAYVKTIGLDNKAHVGGIGYDRARGMLWIGDSLDGHAVISAITQAEIDRYSLRDEVPVVYAMTVYVDSLKAASVLTFADDSLWIGYFTRDRSKSQIQVFSLIFTDPKKGQAVVQDVGAVTKSYVGTDGKWHVSADVAFEAPPMLQGLAYDGEYLYISQSFGSKHRSKLTRYEVTVTDSELQLDRGRSVSLPPYIEQIALDEDDEPRILPLFESVQPEYRAKTDEVVDRIFGISLADFLEASKPNGSAPRLSEIPVTSD